MIRSLAGVQRACLRDLVKVIVVLFYLQTWHISARFRKRRCRTNCGSRDAGGAAAGWGTRRRWTTRPPKSPRGQVQPHPGLNATQLLLRTSSHPWTHLFCFLLKNNKNRLILQEPSKVQQTLTSSISPSALFWYLFLESCFCTVFIVYFKRSTLCTPIFMVGSRPLPPELERPWRARGSYCLQQTARHKSP